MFFLCLYSAYNLAHAYNKEESSLNFQMSYTSTISKHETELQQNKLELSH